MGTCRGSQGLTNGELAFQFNKCERSKDESEKRNTQEYPELNQ